MHKLVHHLHTLSVQNLLLLAETHLGTDDHGGDVCKLLAERVKCLRDVVVPVTPVVLHRRRKLKAEQRMSVSQ